MNNKKQEKKKTKKKVKIGGQVKRHRRKSKDGTEYQSLPGATRQYRGIEPILNMKPRTRRSGARLGDFF